MPTDRPSPQRCEQGGASTSGRRRGYRMKRFTATLGWRGGACLGALLLAVGLAGSASAANTNLTATAKYSASSEWESDKGNTTFIAAKAFDGDITTRWNVHADDTAPGSW